MIKRCKGLRAVGLLLLVVSFRSGNVEAQEKIKLSYSALDSAAIWYVALERGFYKKYGLDAELIFIPTTTTTIASVIAGDVKVANTTGGAVANAVVGGASLVTVGCYVNTLPYELVVHESVKSSEDLRGKMIGISRIGSASDIAARVLIKALGLEPVKDVPIIQVGGSTERAAAFRTGKIIGFPSPPGIINLAKGMPHRVLISTADFQNRFDFPFICATTTKRYFASHRDTVRKVLMALIEASHFFKTRKEESKKIVAKYVRQDNEDFLESIHNSYAKLLERVPLVTREGVEVQIKEALGRRVGAGLKVEDMVDDSIVRELDKSGFIDAVYKQ
ncbi:MAG: ABC transporter substrate-binding protein [Candidatus Binatia bacterium]|nr:ABC transporter substrate-binding protein [Candidatus Binatia bacterium]